jgi:hypothetical protein
MGLKAQWEIVCDCCKKQVTKVIKLDKISIDNCEVSEDGITSTFIDIWSPGIPDGWIQRFDEKLGYPNLFCSENCLDKWCLDNGFEDEIPDKDNPRF